MIYSLHLLRGLLALWVIVYHLSQFAPISSGDQWALLIQKIISQSGALVSVFFVLMGFFCVQSIRYSPQTYTLYGSIKKRISHLYPLYAAMIAISLLCSWYISDGYIQTATSLIIPAISGLTLLNVLHPDTFFPVAINGPLWYVSMDILVFTLISTIYAILKNRLGSPWGIISIGFICLISGHLLFLELPYDQGSGIMWDWFPYYNPFFLALHAWCGVSLALLMTYWTIMRSAWWDILSIGIVIALFVLFFLHIDQSSMTGWLTGPYIFPYIPVLACALIYSLLQSKIFEKWGSYSLFSWLAQLSYSVFLIHGLIIWGIRTYTGTIHTWGIYLIVCVASLTISYLSAYILQRGMIRLGYK